MNIFHATVVGAALTVAAVAGRAQAAEQLPAPSGTLHLAPEGFGGGLDKGPRHYLHEGRHVGHWASRRSYGSAYHYGGVAYGQPRLYGYGQGSVYWNRRVPFYGEGNATLAMSVTGWGTADSATTGGAYPLPSSRSHAAFPVHLAYGTPAFERGNGEWIRGYAPTRGLGYYNSGSPGQLAYYSSASSAGPGGTPGGLGIYSSGAFGPGAKVIHLGRHGEWDQGSGAGPHIIHVHRHDLD